MIRGANSDSSCTSANAANKTTSAEIASGDEEADAGRLPLPVLFARATGSGDSARDGATEVPGEL
jgi:hypothetical protein